jgi:hypothetical protein
LDLACPIPWRSTQTSLPLHHSTSASPTPKSNGASALQSSPSSSVWTSAAAATNNPICGIKTDLDQSQIDQRWLQHRYHETLWLGEQHSPLTAFLQHLVHFERRKGKSTTPLDLLSTLSPLLRSRQYIRKRFVQATKAATDLALGETTFIHRSEALLFALSSDAQGEECNVERKVLQSALESGPGSLVSAELNYTATKGVGKVTKLWLRAMESRE